MTRIASISEWLGRTTIFERSNDGEFFPRSVMAASFDGQTGVEPFSKSLRRLIDGEPLQNIVA